jgi:hypothetical protein
MSQLMYSELCHLPDALATLGSLRTQYREVPLPTGRVVRGREFDGCSVPERLRPFVGDKDKPYGFDFEHACWMHDFAYELIRRGGVPKDAEHIADYVFRDTLRHICATSYHGNSVCTTAAEAYGRVVLEHDVFVALFAENPPGTFDHLPVGTAGQIRSLNAPTPYLAPGSTDSTLSSAGAAAAAGGKFRVVPGLAAQGVSLQSEKYPDRYLRRQGTAVTLQSPDGTAAFKDDATFLVTRGLGGRPDLFSLRAKNSADRYVRHYDGRFEVSSSSTRPGTSFPNDASFMLERRG